MDGSKRVRIYNLRIIQRNSRLRVDHWRKAAKIRMGSRSPAWIARRAASSER